MESNKKEMALSPNQTAPKPPTWRLMKYKCTFSATISDTFKKRGWIETNDDSEDWDIYFCDMNQMRALYATSTPKLADHQRLGHFRNNYEISRKDLLIRNLKRLKARIEKAFGQEEGKKCAFFPTTFILPIEETMFLNEFRYKRGSFWIIKPAAGAQGRGISIFRTINEFYDWREKLTANANIQAVMPQNQDTHQQTYEQYVLDRLEISQDDLKKNDDVNSTQSSEVDTSGVRPPLSPRLGKLVSPNNLRPSTVGREVPNWSRRHRTTDKDKMGEATLTTSMDDLTATNDPSKPEASKTDVYVVQQYISNPYLIGGRKFDIRFFVLVTSFFPLKVWMYREGFARFSQKQFSLKALQDVYVHLTNVAIQRTAEDYNPDKGSKMSLQNLRQYLTTRHGSIIVQSMMNHIDNIVVRTLQSVHQLVTQDPHCFEIYGFDVLIDDCAKPWLLEVNCSPSFTPSNEEDYQLKCAIIDDTISVLNVEGRLLGDEKRVGGYDMIWNDGPVYASSGDSDCAHIEGCQSGRKLNSFLGYTNDRTTHLQTIFTNSELGGVTKSDSSRGSVPKDKDTPREGSLGRGTVPFSKFARNPSGNINDRFRPASRPMTTPPSFMRPRITSSRVQQPPLMVLGKSIHLKGNLNTFLHRCTADEAIPNLMLTKGYW